MLRLVHAKSSSLTLVVMLFADFASRELPGDQRREMGSDQMDQRPKARIKGFHLLCMYLRASIFCLKKILDLLLLCTVLQQDSVTIGFIYIQCDSVLDHIMLSTCVCPVPLGFNSW